MTTALKPYKRRQILEAIFTKLRLAQGNQKHDRTTDNGREACTHVAWCQAVVYLWTGVMYTIDEISKIAGYKRGDVGMNSTHVDRVIKHFKLPYEATWRTVNPRTGNKGDWSANDILKLSREVGPVMVAVGYYLYPLDKELVGSDAEINGYAIQGGRVDLGFGGIHAILVFTSKWRTKLREYRPRILDPDHGFPGQGGVPKFDIITKAQFQRMWDTNLPGKSYGQVGYIPTKAWNGLPDNAQPPE